MSKGEDSTFDKHARLTVEKIDRLLNDSTADDAMHEGMATIDCVYLGMLCELAKSAPSAASSNVSLSGPVYLLEGKPHRLCDCDPFKETCKLGRKRTLGTTEFNRCLLPAPGALITGDPLFETFARVCEGPRAPVSSASTSLPEILARARSSEAYRQETAALDAADSHERSSDCAWVIVRDLPGQLGYFDGAKFNADNLAAIRFAREDDARRMLSLLHGQSEHHDRVQEHMWPSTPIAASATRGSE